jgi:hypothetical protein
VIKIELLETLPINSRSVQPCYNRDHPRKELEALPKQQKSLIQKLHYMLHMNTVFDELGLFKGNNKLLILTHRNNQKSTKEDKS